MNAAERRTALELEADRIKARLDQLNDQINGNPAWLDFAVNLPETVAEVTVDKVLAEARQQALALATIVKTLDGTAAKGGSVAGPGEDPADILAQRRAEKAKAARSQIPPEMAPAAEQIH
jgi:hypothetical protein